MRLLLFAAVALPAFTHAQPAPPFQPQAFLAGSCWKGTFPDGKRHDTHCFEWVYEGKFLRDRHTVEGGPMAYGGETIYYYDAPSKSVHYLYINVLGGHSRGAVAVKEGTLMFPEERYSDGKQEQVYRSAWRRDGDDAYVVLTEVHTPDGWKEAWRMRMQRQK